MPEENHLTDPPADKVEEQDEMNRISEEALKRYLPQQAQVLTLVVGKLQQMQRTIDQLAVNPTNLNLAWTKVTSDPREAVSQADKDFKWQKFDAMTTAAQNLIKQSDASFLREYNLRRYLAGVLGLNLPSGATALTFELLSRYTTNQSTADIDAAVNKALTDDVKNDLKRAAQALAAEKDDDFWGRLHSFCWNNPVTAMDAIYFMQYTQRLFPLTENFVWDGEQLGKKIEGIVKAGQGGGGVNVRSALGTVRSTNFIPEAGATPIPRAVTANYATLALAYLTTNPGVR